MFKTLIEVLVSSHDSNLVGDLESIVLFWKNNISLLESLGGDQSVHLLDLDAVKLLASLLDRGLSGALVNDEHKGVVVLDGLDGRLRWEGVLDDSVLVPSWLLLDSLLHSDSFTCDGKGLGKLESNLVPDLLFPGRVGSLLYSCSRLLCSLLKLKNQNKIGCSYGRKLLTTRASTQSWKQ